MEGEGTSMQTRKLESIHPVDAGGRRRRELLRIAAAACAAGILPGRFAVAADEMEALYAAARREGHLNYYGGGPIATHKGALDAFSRAFPGIEIDPTAGFSNQLTPRIDAQIASGRMEADLAVLQTIQDFERWRRAGALEPFQGPNLDAVGKGFRDADGSSVGVRVFALVYGYNANQVAPQDVPKSAMDFLHPRFAGKIVSTYPQDDDITLYLYHTIVQKHGWGFMEKLVANRPRFIRGHAGVTAEIASGRSALSFDVSAGNAALAARGGAPIRVVFPEEDHAPIWDTRCGIFKGAPHPHAARLFLAWMIGREYQQAQGPWSTRDDAPAPPGFQPISSYRVANGFRDFVLDEAQLVNLRRRFEEYIGPVQGAPVL